MGQEPSKDDAIADKRHEARNSVAKDDHREHSPAREVPRHHAKEEEAVDIEDVEEPHLDLIDLEYHANRRIATDMDENMKSPDRGLQRAATLPANVEPMPNPALQDIQGSSYQTTRASPATDAAQMPESPRQNEPTEPTASNSNDTKIAVGDEEPAKRSKKQRFLLSGFLAGLLLGPFGFLLILWKPARAKRNNLLLLSIGVLLAILVWIVIIAVSVGLSV